MVTAGHMSTVRIARWLCASQKKYGPIRPAPRVIQTRHATLATMALRHTPTIRARRLGTYLRKLREQHGKDFAELASMLGVHPATVRRLEQGTHEPNIDVLHRLLGIYGVEHAMRLELIDLAKNAFVRGWWQQYPELDGVFLGLEHEASLIRTWQPLFVPGILQTARYAASIFRASAPRPPEDEVEKRVRARVSRQGVLVREANPPCLHAVVGEAALRQTVDDEDVMREQLNHLLEVSSRPNVTIQVLPFAAGAHMGLDGSFVLLGFSHADDPDMAYTENLGGGTYSESEVSLARFRMAWGGVTDAALPLEESMEVLSILATER